MTGPPTHRRISRLSAGALLACLLAVEPLRAATVERSIEATLGANRLVVDAALLSAAKPMRYEAGTDGALWPVAGLEDLEILDSQSRHVPFLLIFPQRERTTLRSLRSEPLPVTKEASGFVIDLGKTEIIDLVRIPSAEGDFVKRFWLEVQGESGNSDRWTEIVRAGSVFSLAADGLERRSVEFTPVSARRLRWIWDDTVTPRRPHPGSIEVRVLGGSAAGTAAQSARLEVTYSQLPRRGRTSRYRIDLPGPGLPAIALHVAADATRIHRPARVQSSRRGNGVIETQVLGTTILRRASKEGVTAEDLEIPLNRLLTSSLELLIEDGDQEPLALSGVSLRLAPAPTIYFETRDTRLTARLGAARGPATANDLEADRVALAASNAPWARWGALEPSLARLPANGPSGVSGPQAAFDRSGLSYSRVVGASQGLTRLRLDAHASARSNGGEALRLLNADSRQIPFLVEQVEEPERLQLTAESIPSKVAGGFSRWRIRLPEPELAGADLVLETSSRVFERRVVVRRLEERGERIVDQGLWVHRSADEPAPALVLEPPGLAGEEWILEIEEGNNRPLQLSSVALQIPAGRIRYFGTGAPLELVYGSPSLQPPRYDLELIADEFAEVAAQEIDLGPVSGVAEPAAAPLRRAFWVVVTVVALTLGVLFVRLLKESGPA